MIESKSIKIINSWIRNKILNYQSWNFIDTQSNYNLTLHCDLCFKKIDCVQPFIYKNKKMNYILDDNCFYSHKNCSCCTSFISNNYKKLSCYKCFYLKNNYNNKL